MPGILILTLAQCKKDNESNTEIGQKIYFQSEYINYAWGESHSGFLVDYNGNFHCYNNPEWRFQYSSEPINSAMMDSILKTCFICLKIDKSELEDKIRLLDNAAKGDILSPVSVGADQGSFTYYGFIYDKDSKTYKRILLKETGDQRIDNSSSEANELYEWLHSLRYNVQWQGLSIP